MTSDLGTLEALRAFAKRHGVRVVRCTELNPNVAETVVASAVFKDGPRRLAIGVSSSQFKFELRVDTNLVFSIGQADRIIKFDPEEPLTEITGLPVFARRGIDRRAVSMWVGNLEHLEIVAKIDLARDESIHVYKNMVLCVLSGKRELSDELVSHILTLADAIEKTDKQIPRAKDLSVLPIELASLLEQYGHLAEGDDVIRGEIVEKLDAVEKALFLSRISPLFRQIDRYLDSIVGPWPAAAHELSNLAELGAELAHLEASTPLRKH